MKINYRHFFLSAAASGASSADEYVLVFFTGNRDKIAEIRAILGDTLPFLSVDIDAEEIQTVSVEKVVKRKIIDSYEELKKNMTKLVIKDGDTIINDTPLEGKKFIIAVEDSGLGFEDMGSYKGDWFPGALIKFFYGSLESPEIFQYPNPDNDLGIKKTNQEIKASQKNNKICKMLLGSRAKSTTCVGLYDGTQVHTFCASIEGLVSNPRGNNGFDYDNILELLGPQELVGKTVAELTSEEKNIISPRGIAVRKLKEHIEESGIRISQLIDANYGNKMLTGR